MYLTKHALLCTIIALGSLLLSPAWADDRHIGRVKTLKGEVYVDREGGSIPAELGLWIQESDRIRTGNNSAIGILFIDDTRLALGSDSQLSLSEYRFDRISRDGKAEMELKSGVLSMVAGQLIERKPESLKVRTPTAAIAVRGTAFSVKVNQSAPQATTESR